MKRRLSKISLVILVVVGIILSLLVAIVCDPGPEMSFGFLEGRTLTALIEPRPGGAIYRPTRHVYSFKADFNDVAAEVDAELPTLGFQRAMRNRVAEHHLREYWLGTYGSSEMFKIRILNRQALIVYSNLEFLEDSDPTRYTYTSRDGWVSVEVSRERLRRWPPRYLLINLRMMLRRIARNPPPNK